MSSCRRQSHSQLETRMNRPLAVTAAVLIQTVLGSFYAWSVFVPVLKSEGGLSSAQTQIVFGVMIGVFTVTMAIAGRVLDRVGPRWVASFGGLIYGSGYALASMSEVSFLSLLLNVGVLAGVGIGCGYVSALSTCVRCYPERKGLVTGLAVSGIGLGSVLVSLVSGRVLSAGVDVLTLFLWLGVASGVLILLAASVLRFPPTPDLGPPRTHPRSLLVDALRSGAFWTASTGIFAGTFAGLLVIGNLKPMGLSVGIEYATATMAVSGFAVGNTLGRLVWGSLFDRWRFAVLPVSLTLLGGSILLLPFAGSLPGGFALMSLLVGLCFGACFVVYAALIASEFGPDRLAEVYPLVFLFYGMAAVVGPPVGGWLYDGSGSHTGGVIVAATVAVGGAAAVIVLRQLGRRPSRRRQPAVVLVTQT